MKFSFNLNTENSGFDDNIRAEIGRILRDTADRVEQGDADNGLHQSLFDINGNVVGTFVLK